MDSKDFDLWNNRKKSLDKSVRRLFYKEREIWWCSLGINIGDEIDGKSGEFLRPIIVLKYISRETLLGVPVTSKDSDTNYHIPVKTKRVKSFAKLSQIRVISSKRLFRKIDRMDKPSFEALKWAIVNCLF